MENSKNILIIGDMPGYGKMGLAGMLPILSNMGHSVYNLPTALVSNNFDYGKFSVLDTTAYMRETIQVWQELGFQFDCVTTGFLASADQVDLLRDFIDNQRKEDFLVITDPIMGDEGKLYNGVTENTIDSMRRLVGVADVIVPNLTEGEFLTGLFEGEEALTGEQARQVLGGLLPTPARRAEEKRGRELCEKYLEVVGMKDYLDERPENLSYGMQRRIEIARALMCEPKVLLLDEPLGALDLKLRKDMQIELKRIQQQVGITFIYVTHDQEEALTMSDTIVVMDKGSIQQIGTPEDIYNEPKNAFVADFIGESNIIDGIMRADGVVEIFNRRFQCLDGGFARDEEVDVVIRPEDVDIVPEDQGQLKGTVTSVTFKGMQYDIIVDFYGFKRLIQTTDLSPVGSRIGIKIDPDGIHVMKKSEYSGMFGDYSSYSEEYEEISDASYALDEEESGDEE